uniref:Uncharacterized protein n=1 Tax=Lactuca sativa TaxID=4236 RepID=A0A9R1W7E3_LACSA|nr:hypothetical protein LSAT_V11C300130130 [Lactuca sativa]
MAARIQLIFPMFLEFSEEIWLRKAVWVVATWLQIGGFYQFVLQYVEKRVWLLTVKTLPFLENSNPKDYIKRNNMSECAAIIPSCFS